MYDSKLEREFHKYWKQHKDCIIVPQYKFHPRRKWRFDFAHVDTKTAIEIQGYGEGHTSYEGMRSDYVKHNEAIRLGWKIIYIMSVDISKKKIKSTCSYIEAIMFGKPTPPPPKSLYEQIKEKFND